MRCPIFVLPSCFRRVAIKSLYFLWEERFISRCSTSSLCFKNPICCVCVCEAVCQKANNDLLLSSTPLHLPPPPVCVWLTALYEVTKSVCVCGSNRWGDECWLSWRWGQTPSEHTHTHPQPVCIFPSPSCPHLHLSLHNKLNKVQVSLYSSIGSSYSHVSCFVSMVTKVWGCCVLSYLGPWWKPASFFLINSY